MKPLHQYILLQCRLEVAMAEFGNDSAEADAIRDEMNIPWRGMTTEEVRTARAFCALLNSFEIPDGPIAR